MSQVTLMKITSENWREALELSVNHEQQKFVASVTPPVTIALAKAYIRPGGKIVEPNGIYYQDTMVGFFNLHYTPNSKEDFWLFHFFIDRRFQRRGLGSSALKELFKQIKATHTSCERLFLNVHPENIAGKKFYMELGFREEHILTNDQPTYSLCIQQHNDED